jgi:hypothetical protein
MNSNEWRKEGEEEQRKEQVIRELFTTLNCLSKTTTHMDIFQYVHSYTKYNM